MSKNQSTIQKADKVANMIVAKLETLHGIEKDIFWIGLSDLEKNCVVVSLFPSLSK